MRGLWTLVIGMGVAIVIALAFVVYGIVAGTGPKSGDADFGEISLPLPSGCRLADSKLAGDRILVRIDGLPERGCQQIVILDAATGDLRGRISAAYPLE